MVGKQNVAGYRSGPALLHWLIAALVLFNVVVGITHELYPQEQKILFMGWHKAVGITVLGLAILWVVVHFASARPGPAAIPRWQQVTAKIVQGLMLIILLVLPVSGWWMISASPKRTPIDYFGLFDIPFLPVVQGAEGFGNLSHHLHGLLGLTLTALVALHILAALWHQYVAKDNVLLRMRPFQRR